MKENLPHKIKIENNNILKELTSLLIQYDQACISYAPGVSGQDRRQRLGQIVDTIKAQDPAPSAKSILVELFKFYHQEKNSSFNSRLVRLLQQALMTILKVPTVKYQPFLPGYKGSVAHSLMALENYGIAVERLNAQIKYYTGLFSMPEELKTFSSNEEKYPINKDSKHISKILDHVLSRYKNNYFKYFFAEAESKERYMGLNARINKFSSTSSNAPVSMNLMFANILLFYQHNNQLKHQSRLVGYLREALYEIFDVEAQISGHPDTLSTAKKENYEICKQFYLDKCIEYHISRVVEESQHQTITPKQQIT